MLAGMRPLVAVVAALPACGVISTGVDYPGFDSGATDAGPPDNGPIDMGMIDMGVIDTGVEMDAGDGGDGGDGGCTPIAEPPFPAAWPFPATKSGYMNEFWSPLPVREFTCSQGGCHGGGMGSVAPLIPVTETDLDSSQTVADAVSQLWASAATITQVEPPSPAPTMTWIHDRARAGRTDPEYLYDMAGEQLTFLNAFIAKGAKCRWKGVTPMAGQCEVPIPASELTHCGP
jgi:hypothetical protein